MEIQRFAAAFRAAAEGMEENRVELCRLDTGIGDGDHGITIERGFRAAAAVSTACDTFSDLFAAIAHAMEPAMGGAIGPLYVAFFAASGSATEKNREVGDAALVRALDAGVRVVAKAGDVKEGQKTVLDAMAPWMQAMTLAVDAGADLAAAAQKGADAASAGARSTKDMVAVKGRARYRGERSVGQVDPGAWSFALFARRLAVALEKRTDQGGGVSP